MWTKTFAMIGSAFVAVFVVPVLMVLLLKRPKMMNPDQMDGKCRRQRDTEDEKNDPYLMLNAKAIPPVSQAVHGIRLTQRAVLTTLLRVLHQFNPWKSTP